MKKILIILGLSSLLAGCQSKPGPSSISPLPSESPQSIFTSIADAVQKQIVLKCEYADEDGDKTITYIKGQTVRMVGQDDDDKKMDGLMKDGKFYIWSDENKQGMVIDMAKLEGASMGETPINSIDDVIGVLESQKDKCAISPESAGLLDLPSGIEFTPTN